MGDPLTSLEGGAGVGSGLGKVYKSPPPSPPLNRGPQKARSAQGGHSLRLLPGGGGGGGGSERAPGLERSGQRTPSCEDYPGKCLSPWLEPRRGALGADDGSARRQIRAAESVARELRGDRASRPRRAHHGQLLGHRGPAVRAAWRFAAYR